MNHKGEKLGMCGFEGIKGSPIEPSEVGLNFDTWLRVLNGLLGVQISVVVLGFLLDTCLNPIG